MTEEQHDAGDDGDNAQPAVGEGELQQDNAAEKPAENEQNPDAN